MAAKSTKAADVVYSLTPGTPIYVKTADVSVILGKSDQWVGNLAQKGVLVKVKTEKGNLFDLTASLKGYLEWLSEQSSKDPEIEELDKKKRQLDNSIKASKAIKENLFAKELQGEMHRSEDVRAMTEDLLFAVKNGLTTLIGRLSVEIAGISDPADIPSVIKREVYLILNQLSNYKYDSRKYKQRVDERRKKAADNGGDPDSSEDAEGNAE